MFVSFPTLSRHQAVSLSQSSVCRRSSLVTGKGGRGGVGRNQIIRRRKSLFLYESVNTLCVGVASQYQSTLHFISVESKTPDHTTVQYTTGDMYSLY